MEDFLFPEKEIFYFPQNDDNEAVLREYFLTFKEWTQVKRKNHEETQTFIHENFDFEVKQDQLKCQCSACTGSYRNEIKEIILKSSIELIEKAREELTQDVDYSLEESSNIFTTLKKDIDQNIQKARYRLRRRAYVNLEGQIKSLLKKNFLHPAATSIGRENKVLDFLKNHLLEEGFNDDLVDEKEFKKFFQSTSAQPVATP